MVLLMVVTIGYLPIVLPLLLPGVEVDAGAIAQSLVVLMLVPLAIGLLIRANAADTADEYGHVFTKASSLAIVVLMVVGLGLSARNILGLLGTGGIIALLLFVARLARDRRRPRWPRPRRPRGARSRDSATKCLGGTRRGRPRTSEPTR